MPPSVFKSTATSCRPGPNRPGGPCRLHPANRKLNLGSSEKGATLWSRVKAFLNPPQPAPVPAVCIPPGARLRLDEIPAVLQIELHAGPTEEVTFAQLSAAANTYRDRKSVV